LCSCLCKYWTSWKLKRWWVKCKFSTGTILRTVSKFLYRIPVSFFVGPRTVAKHECYADLNVLKNLTYINKAMLHGAIFLATCNAILLLRDVN
jgi:hypothetical protein